MTTAPAEEAPESRTFFDTEHLKSDLKRRSVRGGAATGLGQGASFVIRTGSTMVLARLLTPADFGLIAMVTAVTGFAELFKDLGLSMATVQKAEITDEQVSFLFWVNAGLSLLIALVTAALAPLIARFYGEPRLALVTMVLSLAFVFGGLTIQHQALLRRQMRFGALAAIPVVGMVIGTIAAVVAAGLGAGYWALVVMVLARSIADVLGVWFVCRWWPRLPTRGAGVRSMLRFGANLTGYSVINYIAVQIDRVLIGRYIGAMSVGLYNRAFSLLLLPLRQVNAPVAAIAIPALSRIVDDPDRYRKAYFKMLNSIVMVTVPGVAFLIATSDWIIRVVLGPGWEESIAIFSILGLAALLMPIGNTTGWLYVTQGRTRDMMHWGLVGAVVRILSVLIGLRWGITGVAVAHVSRAYLLSPVCIWFCCRKGPIRSLEFLRVYLYTGILAVPLLIAIFAFRELSGIADPIAGIVLTSGIALIVTAMTLRLLPEGAAMLKGATNYALVRVKGRICRG